MVVSESSFRSIFASNPIIIFDTNIYLDLLRWSKSASTELLQLYRSIIDDLYVPAQVYKEFKKNMPKVNGQRIRELTKARAEIKNAINACKTKVTTQIDVFSRHKFADSTTISESTISNLEEIKNNIEDYINNIVKDADSFLNVLDVTAFFDSIWNADTAIEYKPSRLMDIYRDGDIRYRYKIPPGYMDAPQNNSSSAKDGVDVFGDLLLWNQILDYGRSEQRPVIFVTADVKEDWFLFHKGTPKTPRDELLMEFREKTDGIDICIITSELFVKYLSSIKTINTSDALLEMQMDDYADITIRNHKDEIFQALVLWGNAAENILQFPFPDDVNTLLNVSDIRYVLKSVSLQMEERIKYSVVIEGVAEFSGVNYDKTSKRNISPVTQASFRYDLRISFMRPYTKDTSDTCIPSDRFEDLEITNAILEAVPSTNISLESRRGTFITPTPQDEEISKYMEGIWDEYEAQNSVNKAEALVYFDAATHFQTSLLEINRAYTLVQNSKSKTMLSLNEIDALALKRFSDINIEIRGEMAFYNESTVRLGNSYPIPESMQMLPPEIGRKIEVTFTLEAKDTDEGFIICTGTTTLPFKTKLLLTLRSPEQKYNAQSKVVVNADGSFSSESFSNAQNPQGKMHKGVYSLEIVVPIASVQPEEVKLALGTKGRNLAGPYVNEDTILGKTIRYEKEFVT